jgi:hypothetical protein
MKTKLFELRDEGTFIPIIATLMAEPDNEAEEYLLARAGYSFQYPSVLVDRLEGGYSDYRPYSQHGGGPRTFPTAHKYIEEHWHELESGQVIDVLFILGESNFLK